MYAIKSVFQRFIYFSSFDFIFHSLSESNVFNTCSNPQNMYNFIRMRNIILTTNIIFINANSRFTTVENSRISDFLRSTKRSRPDDLGTSGFFKIHNRLMKPIPLDAIKISKSKNNETKVEPVETLEFEKKYISPTNLIQTRVELELSRAKTDQPDRKMRNKFSFSKRRFTPLAKINIPDILKLNKNLEQQQGFDGSHLSHFMKAMDDYSLKASNEENLKIKPACKGLNWYVSVFDCER